MERDYIEREKDGNRGRKTRRARQPAAQRIPSQPLRRTSHQPPHQTPQRTPSQPPRRTSQRTPHQPSRQAHRQRPPGETLLRFAALLSAAALLLILLFLAAGALPAVRRIGFGDFLLGKVWDPEHGVYGIFPMLIGSILVTAGAALIAGSVGTLTAVYIAAFCPKALYRAVKILMSILAGIPSVIYGMFGLAVLVPQIRALTGGSGKGILTASILLGWMILPTVVNTAEPALRAVPTHFYEVSRALGATHEDSVFRVLLPEAASGIRTGIVLGIGRAVGEATAVMMVCGNQPILPKSILSGTRTLTANIMMELGYASGLHRDALIAAATVLLVFVLLLNLAPGLIRNRIFGEKPRRVRKNH